MANSWFQFKRFKICQEQAAMKVSTDACIFGAWLNSLFTDKQWNVLDVGTGTGLLSLMYLQGNPESRGCALEPNAAAAQDARGNFEASDWKNNIILESATFQKFSENNNRLFDLIICNPPFFQNHLQAEQTDRSMARHDALLPMELAEGARRLTNNQGLLAVIYPETVWKIWLSAAEKSGWYLRHQLNIQPTVDKSVNRICGVFGRDTTAVQPVFQHLLIRENNDYTPKFKSLLQPYYLNL